MRKVPTPLDLLKKTVVAIECGHFELIDCEVVAVKSEPGRYTVVALLERLVAPGSPNKRPPRQSKVRELIFDDGD
ncbi:MAG TPA: hypothetical protein VFC35_03905 [Gemmatimonadaceae bacterium]|nr:hypothetical protein [Gemmatimonadaceae bacterium]